MAQKDLSNVRDLSSGHVRSLLAVGLSGKSNPVPDVPDNSVDNILNANKHVLGQIIADLQAPCPDTGPFSLYRLCGIEPMNSKGLMNQSWLQLLTSRKTDRETLECLARVGEIMSQLQLSEVTRLSGILIQRLAADALSDNQDNLFQKLSSVLD